MKAIHTLRTAPLASPLGLIRLALLLLLVFLGCHLAGLRKYMSALALTFPPGTKPELGFFYCGVYLLFYLISCSAVPVLVLAAAILATWNQLSPPTLPPQSSGVRVCRE